MKGILKEVISRLGFDKTKYCRIKHKRGWLEFLNDGDLAFDPADLHRILRDVIDTEDNRPRGRKLLCRHRKTAFTMKADGVPYRPEEALERFVIVSNPVGFYNQLPIGGRKESVDIVVNDHDKMTFVELKPWNSSNPPLYALMECLKNLMEYRIIFERGINGNRDAQDVGLCVLAPDQYYRTYGLLDRTMNVRSENTFSLQKGLDDIASEFHADLSFASLHLEKEQFLSKCNHVFQRERLTSQSIVSVHEDDAIQALMKTRWNCVVKSIKA